MAKALAAAGGKRTEGHALVDLDIFSDFRRLTDYNAGTVVDEEIFANRGARVDIYTGEAVGILGHHTWNQRHTEKEEFVSQAVHKDRVETRVGKDDLIRIVGCRVAVVACLDVGHQHLPDGRNPGQKLIYQRSGLLQGCFGACRRIFFPVLQGTGGLFRQVVVNVLEDLSHMVGQRILLEVSGLKISRENDLPDICTLSLYDPELQDLSDKMLDLSGYAFTDNYVESRLKEVSDDGAIYMLPSAYNCFGITYNKTLLEKHGWTLPKSFKELEQLAKEAEKAGVQLCLPQIQYPGYGFQYLCNIADTGFLSSLDGRQWQKDYLSGKANVSDTEGMMDSIEYIQKWKELGMLDGSNSNPIDDAVTKDDFIKGNTLFMLGSQNGITDSDATTDEFGLMPYLSEDGSKNVYILSMGRYYGLNKKLEDDSQKLEDALKVMEVLSTVEGTSSLYPEASLKTSLLPFKDAKAEDTYYGDIADAINAGNTAPLIYSGWENTLVTTGTKMLEYMQDKATIEDVVKQLEDDQESVVNNKPEVITTTTEVISQENCAQLVGRCFAQATGSDLALVSLGTWISGNGLDQNNDCVSTKMYAKDITVDDLSVIIPTGWTRTIQTVSLTGKQIQALYEEGYDAVGTGKNYPYVLVNPEDLKLEEGKTYQVAISGISEKLASETEVTDSGIVGMDAAKEFFGQFKTLSEADAEWK